MSVSTAYRSGRHIIKVVNAFNGKRNVAVALYEGEIAPLIHNLWEVNDAD